VSLYNQGPSIPDYALERLSERFYSLPRPGSGRKSTGLGLNFVAEVAALHGGELASATSRAGWRRCCCCRRPEGRPGPRASQPFPTQFPQTPHRPATFSPFALSRLSRIATTGEPPHEPTPAVQTRRHRRADPLSADPAVDDRWPGRRAAGLPRRRAAGHRPQRRLRGST
jgi:hypothetical protein